MSKNKKQKTETSKKITKSKPKKTKKEVTSKKLKELLAAEKDKNLRLFAEFENYRKRTAKERIELFSTANKDIMSILLPILDNFERSIKANNYGDEDGTVLIYKQLMSELKKKGLKPIENPIGKELDTDFHEAITNIPAPSKDDEGKIIDVIEKGYLLGEKVLRYAKVVVGNKK